jgi:hypothetical protein
MDPFGAVSKAIADGRFSDGNVVESLYMPLHFSSGYTKTFAYYDPDFIVLFTGGEVGPTEGGGADATTVGVAAGVSVGAVVLIAGTVGFVWYIHRKREEERNEKKLASKLGTTTISESQTTTLTTDIHTMDNGGDTSNWRASRTKGLEIRNK